MVYIAGQITGLPRAEVQSKFEQAEQLLRRLDLKVINPLKLGISESWTWEDQLAECKRVIRKDVTAIYFLPGWQNSKGARQEYELVNELNQLPNRKVLVYEEEEHGYSNLMRDIRDQILTCLIPQDHE